MAGYSTSPTSVSEQRCNDSELRGKIEKYKLLNQLLKEKDERCRQQEAALNEEKSALRSLREEYKRLCEDLQPMRTRPEYSELFEKLEPFRDISDETLSTAAISATLQSTSDYSVTEAIVNAAEMARNLENRNEMLQVMLYEKDAEMDKLKKQIQESEDKKKSMEDQERGLTIDIEQLKEKISSSSPTELSPGRLDVQTKMTMADPGGIESSPDISIETTMEPTELMEKIKQLQQRVAELMNHNQRWNEQCEGLKREVEDAKSRIADYERLLNEECKKTQIATAERDTLLVQVESEREQKKQSEVLCRQLSEQVTQLETRVQELEKQLADSEQSFAVRQILDVTQTASPLSVDEDALAVYQIQAEGYREDFQAEQKDHNRTKEQLKSLGQQWQTIYNELRVKKDELERLQGEMKKERSQKEKLEKLLSQANVDRTLIERCLEGTGVSSIPVSPAASGLERGTQQRLMEARSPVRPPSHGVLEVDGTSHRRETIQAEGLSWTCAMCTFVNTSPQFVMSCEICETSRTGVEKKTFPSSSYWSSCSGKQRSGHGGAMLEEDGISSPRFVSVFN